MAKATNLIKAYMNEEIPFGGGFIVSAFFDHSSVYSIYEVTAYNNVKDIYKSPDGLVFKTDGNRTHMLIEPATFSKKHMDPVNREEGKQIPYRLNELDIHTCKKSEKIMTPREPKLLHSSFTILEKDSDFFAFVFHPTKDVYIAMKRFIADSLYNDCNLSKQDAMEGATSILNIIKQFTIWQG